MEIYKCSETEAQRELKRIADDEQITGQNIDWTVTDEESNKEEDDIDEPSEESESSGAD